MSLMGAQFLHLQLPWTSRRSCAALLLDDAPQRRLAPLVPVRLLALRAHLQILLGARLGWDPAAVDAENVDFLKDATILLQNHADQRHGLARFRRPEEDAGARNEGAPRGPRVACWCTRSWERA